MQNHLLIFLHIPKTGGTTLRNIIDKQHAAESVFSIDDDINTSIKKFRILDGREREQLQVLQGHMSLGLHRYFQGSTSYITILREPLDRAISDYFYVSTNVNHPLHDVVKDMGLRGYFDSEVTGQLSNGQTRLLCGDCEHGDAGIPTMRKLDQIDLERAKQYIREHFGVVGLQEHFDQTLILLKRKYGWKYPYYIKANVNKTRPYIDQIDKDVRDLIVSKNNLDVALYGYAKKLFMEQIKEQGVSFHVEVFLFRILNNIHQYVHKIKTEIYPSLRNKLGSLIRSIIPMVKQ